MSINKPHKMRVSVIIPHLNQPDFLARCLASLHQGSTQADEIIVVDNGSHQLPESIVAPYPTARLLHEPTPGPGPARNCGIAAAQGDILAFIDSDCLASPDWLATGLAVFTDPDAMILGGDVRIALENPNKLTMIEAYESIYAYRMDRYIREQGFTGTGNLMMRRSVFGDVGAFAGLEIAEDRDWCHRAGAKGYAIRYIAPMRVYHPARPDFAGLYAKWDRQLAHDYTGLQNKGDVKKIIWALKAAAMVFSAMAELPRIARSDRVTGIKNRLLAFSGLFCIRFYRMYRMIWLLCGGDAQILAKRWNR